MAEKEHAGQPLDVTAVLPVLDKISLFGGLSEDQLRTLVRHAEAVSYTAGERIFAQGDAPSHIYIILRGRVKIVVDIDETPLELVAYEEGHCFGETSAIGIQPHSATALVEKDADLIVLSAHALQALYNEEPRLYGMLILNIAREACRRLHRTDQLLFHYAAAKDHGSAAAGC